MIRWLAFVLLIGLAWPAAADAATYQTIYTFAKNPNDPNGYANPAAPLLVDGSGALYGLIRGANPAAYKLTPPTSGTRWTRTTLFNFPTAGGCLLQSALVMDGAGNLYGTGRLCRESDIGFAYQLSPPTSGKGYWIFKQIYNFGSRNNRLGDYPGASLQIGTQGNLFGSTFDYFFNLGPPKTPGGPWVPGRLGSAVEPQVLNVGGAFYAETPLDLEGDGTILRFTNSGRGWFSQTIFQFTDNNGTFPNGANPTGGVVMDSAGNLYGVGGGGSGKAGVVFQLTAPPTASSVWGFSLIYTFQGPEGAGPVSVIFDKSGNLYGLASCGGKWSSAADYAVGEGVFFKLAPPAIVGGNWTYSIVYQPAKPFFPQGNCNSNTYAFNKLLAFGPDGALYGTANGPANTGGSVFRLVP